MKNCLKAVSRSCETMRTKTIRRAAMLTKETPTMGEAVVRIAKILNGEIKQPKSLIQNGIYGIKAENTLYCGKSRNVAQRLNSHSYTDFKHIGGRGFLICSCKREWDTNFMNSVEGIFIKASQIYAAMFGYSIKNKNKIYKGDLLDLLTEEDQNTINAYFDSLKSS